MIPSISPKVARKGSVTSTLSSSNHNNNSSNNNSNSGGLGGLGQLLQPPLLSAASSSSASLRDSRLSARDERIQRLERSAVRQEEDLAAALDESAQLRNSNQTLALQHELERKDLAMRNEELQQRLQMLEHDLEDSAIHKYATLIREAYTAGSDVDTAYVLRLKAHATKALHKMSTLVHQLETTEQTREQLSMQLRGRVVQVTEEKLTTERECMNGLIKLEREKNQMKERYERRLVEQSREMDYLRRELARERRRGGSRTTHAAIVYSHHDDITEDASQAGGTSQAGGPGGSGGIESLPVPHVVPGSIVTSSLMGTAADAGDDVASLDENLSPFHPQDEEDDNRTAHTEPPLHPTSSSSSSNPNNNSSSVQSNPHNSNKSLENIASGLEESFARLRMDFLRNLTTPKQDKPKVGNKATNNNNNKPLISPWKRKKNSTKQEQVTKEKSEMKNEDEQSDNVFTEEKKEDDKETNNLSSVDTNDDNHKEANKEDDGEEDDKETNNLSSVDTNDGNLKEENEEEEDGEEANKENPLSSPNNTVEDVDSNIETCTTKASNEILSLPTELNDVQNSRACTGEEKEEEDTHESTTITTIGSNKSLPKNTEETELNNVQNLRTCTGEEEEEEEDTYESTTITTTGFNKSSPKNNEETELNDVQNLHTTTEEEGTHESNITATTGFKIQFQLCH